MGRWRRRRGISRSVSLMAQSFWRQDVLLPCVFLSNAPACFPPTFGFTTLLYPAKASSRRPESRWWRPPRRSSWRFPPTASPTSSSLSGGRASSTRPHARSSQTSPLPWAWPPAPSPPCGARVGDFDDVAAPTLGHSTFLTFFCAGRRPIPFLVRHTHNDLLLGHFMLFRGSRGAFRSSFHNWGCVFFLGAFERTHLWCICRTRQKA